MNRTTMFAAGAIAILGGVLYALHLDHYERKATGGETLGVIVLMRELPAGGPITRDAIGIRQVPRRFVEDRHVRAAQLIQVLGVGSQRVLAPGNWLTWDDVGVDGRNKANLSDTIPNGLRAFTVIMESQNFGQMVKAGDRVDVLFTAKLPEDPDHPRNMLERRNIPTLTTVLLQNVMVLAVGARQTALEGDAAEHSSDQVDYDARRRNARDAKFITLTMGLMEASVLYHAINFSEALYLIVRNPDDESITTEIPITTDLDLIEAEQRARIERRRPPVTQIRRID